MSDDTELEQSREPHVIIEDETLAAGFTQIPNGVLRRSDLQPGAKLTYMVLLSYAWQKNHAYPGQDSLARDMGVSERSVITYLKQLRDSGLVSIRRRGLGMTNVYIINRIPGSANSADQEVKDSTPLEVQDLPPKKTQWKKTQTDISNSPDPELMIMPGERMIIERYAKDFATELRDEAPLQSTVSRLANLYRHSGLGMDAFLDLLQDARQITQKRSAGIRKDKGDGSGLKSKMAYMFGVLEDLIEKRGA